MQRWQTHVQQQIQEFRRRKISLKYIPSCGPSEKLYKREGPVIAAENERDQNYEIKED